MSRDSALAVAAPFVPKAVEPSALQATSTPHDGSSQSSSTGGKTGESPQSTSDELVSTRIAQIARKEARYREEQEAYKKNKAEFDPFFAKYKEFEAMKAKDPVAAIKMLGFSDTDYVNFIAAQEDKSTPEERAARIADAKIAEFKAEQAKEKQTEESRRNEESIGQFKKNIGITLKTDADRFEMCNFYGEAAEALIFQTVQEAYQEDLKTNPAAEPMTAEAAADLVEKYYEEHAESMKKLKKFNKAAEETPAEVAPVKRPEPVKVEQLRAEVSAQPKTLTNKVGATATSTAPKIESRAEKRERLMRALANGGKL